MAEDKETYKPEQEEYQYAAGEEFSEEFGGAEEYQSPSEGRMTLPGGAFGRKFLVPVIILVVAAGIYLFMRITSEPAAGDESVTAGPTSIEEKLALTPAEPSDQQAAAESPVISAPIPTPAVSEEAISPATQQASFEAEQKALAAIQEKSSRDEAAINQLQSTISELQTTVGDLGKAIVSISEKMSKIEGVRKPAAKQRKVRSTRATMRPRVPPMVYEVKSVVPGRAWIQSSTGEFLSVGVGETLPGYGKVESINAATGSVRLSSGAVIEYGYFDR